MVAEHQTRKPLIEFRQVAKAFGDVPIFKDLNLDVFKGETLCLIGPSGVGKTVTIKMLVGLETVDRGEIFFDGIAINKLEKEEDFLPVRKRIAMVFQGAALFDSMTVFDNVAYPLKEHLKLNESELKDRVFHKLELVGLPNAAQKYPSELSGGMKKRIGLARAIAIEPEVILYDEPTAGLDPLNTVRIIDLIMSLQERLNCTSVLVTHDIVAAERLRGRVAFVYDYKISAMGTIETLRQSENIFVRAFMLGDPSLVDNK